MRGIVVLDGLIDTATVIRAQRYADAMVMFLAGSFVRGEGTPYSDLDLVVVYQNIPCAYRESFHFQGYPVEAFVHDPETLNYFFMDADRSSGVPSLIQMVLEGIEIPESTDAARPLKRLAESVLAMGPPALSQQDRDRLRYGITDLLDDIRAPRSTAELVGSGAELFTVLANYYLRTRGMWSGKGKSILRALERADTDLCRRYSVSFDALFTQSDPRLVIELAEELLERDGGLLFDGYRLDAPATSRKPLVANSTDGAVRSGS